MATNARKKRARTAPEKVALPKILFVVRHRDGRLVYPAHASAARAALYRGPDDTIVVYELKREAK